ncbi:hypothetical protein NC652_026457 [Populus alba x Populus x berolinensis]|nr:hypothetical protein NC652_026457 [Populus alba x Populus x berolinensis]
MSPHVKFILYFSFCIDLILSDYCFYIGMCCFCYGEAFFVSFLI